jgi:hypothetical protein
MRLADHVTLLFNNKISMAAVSLDIEKAFDTTWHRGLLYKLTKIEFSTSVIKFISSFLTERKFRVSVEGEISTPRHSATRFRSVSYTIQLVLKSPNTWCTPSSLCRLHLSICHKIQGGLRSEKTPARSKLIGGLVLALQYNIIEDKTRAI